MSLRELRSLEVVLEEIRAERQVQLQHFDALDTRAGILLGFAGVLVALSPRTTPPLIDVGRALAVSSGLFSLGTFWPRRFWTTDLRTLRDLYLASELRFTRLHLLDTQIAMVEDMRSVLLQKSRRLKAAMVTLAGATLLTAAGVALQ